MDRPGAEQGCSCRGSPAHRALECRGDAQEPSGEAENSWPGGAGGCWMAWVGSYSQEGLFWNKMAGFPVLITEG